MRSFGYFRIPFVFCLCYDFKEDDFLIDRGWCGLPNMGLVSQSFAVRWRRMQIVVSADHRPEPKEPCENHPITLDGADSVFTGSRIK